MLTLLVLFIIRYYILLFALFTHSVLFSVNMKGKAKCILCTKVITYDGCGFPSLSDHIKTENHVRTVVIKLENYCLPGTSNPIHEHGGMYGAPLIYLDQVMGSSSSKTPPHSAVHILDCKANMEVMLESFLAEKYVSFTLAGK